MEIHTEGNQMKQKNVRNHRNVQKKAPFYREPFFGALWGMMLLGCLLIFHNYIFGNETLVFDDIGSDTRQQYLMLYNSLVNHVRCGNLPFWDFSNGLGANAFVIQLTHPLLVFVYLGGILSGPEHLAGLMIYYYMAEICLSGSFCYLYLTGYRLSGPCKMIASFLYAFNGYLMIWGQHYQLGSIVVLLPLLYYFIDELIRAWRGPDSSDFNTEKKSRLRSALGIAAIGGIILLNGYYQGYMSFLAAGIYVCIRVFITEKLPFTRRLSLLFAQAGSLGGGLILGMLNLLPSFSLIFSSSSRMDSGGTSSLSAFLRGIRRNLNLWPRSYYKDLWYRFFGNNLQGTPVTHMGWENYYEQINLFFSALLFLLLIQFFFTLRRQEGTLHQKTARVLGAVLIVFSVTVKLGSYVFNGFAYAFERHTFLFMPFFALLCGWMLGQVLEKRIFSRIGFMVGAAGLAMVYVRAWQINRESQCRMNAGILLATGLGMIAVLWISGQRKPGALSGYNEDDSASASVLNFPEKATDTVSNQSIGRKKPKTIFAGREYKTHMTAASTVGILAVLLFIHVISDARLGFTGRYSVKKNDPDYFEKTYHGDVTEALEWIAGQDDSFCRVEKTFSTAAAYMESCAQGYYGVSTYNSVQNRNIQNFVEGLWPGLLTGYDTNHYLFSNDLTNVPMASLTGVKYLLSDRDDLRLNGWERLHQTGTVTIYRNLTAHGLGTAYQTILTEEEFQNRPEGVDVPALLQDVLIVDEKESALSEQERDAVWNRYRLEEVEGKETFPEEGITGKGEGFRISLPDFDEADSTDVDPVCTAVLRVSADRPVLIHVQLEEGVETVLFNNGNRSSRFRLRIPSAVREIKLYANDPQAILQVEELRFYRSQPGWKSEKKTHIHDTDNEAKESDIRIERPLRDDRLTGTMSLQEDGIVLLTIPYEKGWEVLVDGKPAELLCGDYGFLAFHAEAGTHALTIEFHAPGLKTGALLSGAGWLAWLLLLFFARSLTQNKQSVKIKFCIL